MPSLPKLASSVQSTNETIDKQFAVQTKNNNSPVVANQQALDHAHVNGKVRAAVHEVPSKLSYDQQCFSTSGVRATLSFP